MESRLEVGNPEVRPWEKSVGGCSNSLIFTCEMIRNDVRALYQGKGKHMVRANLVIKGTPVCVVCRNACCMCCLAQHNWEREMKPSVSAPCPLHLYIWQLLPSAHAVVFSRLDSLLRVESLGSRAERRLPVSARMVGKAAHSRSWACLFDGV